MELALVELAAVAAREGVQAAVRATVDRHIGQRKKKQDRDREIDRAVARIVSGVDESALSRRVQEAHSWASEIQVQGMHRAIGTDAASIALTFAGIPRRFRSSAESSVTLSEDDLATSQDCYLVLGEPGSGKTTTLKRVVLSLFEESPVTRGNEALALPVVVVCRFVNWSATDLVTEVVEGLGVSVARVRQELDLSNANAIVFAAELLDQSSCLLVVDGLDEIADPDARSSVLQTLSRLQQLVQRARIICSCRSGDAPHLEGFAVAELLPLSRSQVQQIAALRTSTVEDFLSHVESAGIDPDLLDRPLFLNQLLTVFENTGTLPERPVDLHRQLIRLLLREWDEQRRVRRRSQYRDFDPETKRDFLSEIAFRLTLRGRATFTEDELLAIYDVIHDRFDLPHRQAIQVVREIESHIGIVQEVAGGFQFSHFTMQEYLAADHISRRPVDDEVAEYLRRFPSVVAVAVALSSNPEAWLTECVKRSRDFDPPKLAATFASRLGLERPRFTTSLELGLTMLTLLRQADASEISSWRRLSEMDAIRASVSLTSERFHFEQRGPVVSLARRRQDEESDRRRPSFSKIPTPIFELFAGDWMYE